MLHISLSIKDKAAADALESFINKYNQDQGDDINYYCLLGVDGNSDILGVTDYVPWKWYEERVRPILSNVKDKPEVHPVNVPVYWTGMPDELKNKLLQHMKSHLMQLKSIKDGKAINSVENHDLDIGAIMAYAEEIQADYDGVDSLLDCEASFLFHEKLIELVLEAKFATVDDVENVRNDKDFLDVVFNACEELTAIALYLLHRRIDYFWSMIALSKAQQWLGLYVGSVKRSSASESIGAYAKSLKNERVNDEILRSIILVSRHWRKRKLPKNGCQLQFSKTLKNELIHDKYKVSTRLLEKIITRLAGRGITGYEHTDIQNKIENAINDSKSNIYRYLIDYESVRSETRHPSEHVDDVDEICFYSQMKLTLYIEECIRNWLIEGKSPNEITNIIAKLNQLTLVDEPAPWVTLIQHIEKEIKDPVNNLIKLTKP